jgi:hypothetical protein
MKPPPAAPFARRRAATAARIIRMFGLNLTLAVFGIVALGMALWFLWERRGEGKKLGAMAAMPTTPAANVGKLAAGSAVEVKGTLRCAAPVAGEFSQKPWAYFKAEIIREETWYERDSGGKNRQRSSETVVHTNIQQGPCTIEDASGRVAIDLTGATVEGTEVFNEAEGNKGAVGDLVGSLTGVGLGSTTMRRKEVALASDIPIYALGEARADGSIGAPAKGSRNTHFLVSQKSEEEQAANLSSSMSMGLWFAGLCALLGVILLAWAWIKGPT